MLAGDGNFGLLFVVHFEHEAGFEPGHHFLDVLDVDEVGAMRAPEGVGIECFEKLIERTIVGSAFGIFGHDGDKAAFNRSEDEVSRIHQEHALLRTNEDFGRLHVGGLGSSELIDELLEPLGGTVFGFNFAFDLLNGAGETGFVKGL